MPESKKNTLRNTSLTKPLTIKVPPKNPIFSNFNKPIINKPNKVGFTFRDQKKGISS